MALVLSTAGAFQQDKDEHMSCAAAKLLEGYVCSKQALSRSRLNVRWVANTVETPC